MTKAKILIVEDEPFVAQNLKNHLEHAGYEVQGIVVSGESALASVAESCPDLVMMDIVLEGQMDGIQAAQQIRARFDIPVIYLTAFADDNLFQRAKITEPFAFLLKPFNERELQLTLEMALYRHQMENRLRESEAQLTNERLQREIIARERVEQALLESEDRYRSIVEASPDAIFVLTNGNVALANSAATKLLGVENTEELTGTRPEKWVHPDYLMLINQRMKAALENRSVNPLIPYKMIRRDGTTVDVETVSFAFDYMGVSSLLVMVRDVSARHAAEKSLRDSEEKFRQLAENIREVFWIKDKVSRKILYVSPAYAEIWGRTCESLLAHPGSFLEAVYPDDQKVVTAAYRRPNSEEVEFDQEYRISRPDGSIRWIWARTFPVRDENGRVYRTAGMAEDITARKSAEEELRESEEKFRMMFEHAPVGFAIVGKDYRFAKANQTWCAMLGYSLDELQNKTFGDITSPEDIDRSLDLGRKLFSGEASSIKLEKRYVRKNGAIFWGGLTAAVIHDEQGLPLYVLSIVEDISERIQVEASRLEHEVAQRNTLVKEVHHRIKNNLQGVVGLLRQHAAQHPTVKQALEAAIARINSIAMVYGLQSEDLQEQVKLCDMICGICSSAQIMMEAIIEPIVEVEVIKPVKITKDEAVPIALILNELIYNAIKHSRKDKTCESIQVFMGGDENRVEVRVRNKCANLPAGFDFAAGIKLGTGLSLVKSLLPHNGAQLDFFSESDTVIAQLVLTPPVIVNEAGITDDVSAAL